MVLSNFTRFFYFTTSTLGLIILSNSIWGNTANAFSVTFDNGGFEQSIGGGLQNSWNTIGDVQNGGTLDVVSPTSGSNQAIMTTGYIPGNYAHPIGDRNDDVNSNDNSNLNFNFSGTQPVSADVNPNADLLQQHFGFGTDAFSIDRSITGSFLGDFRTSKEGSGMFQEFDVTLGAGETGFTVSFDWAFLSNDGATSIGGNQDFAFWSLGQYDSGTMTYTTVFDGSEDGTNDTFDTNEVTVLRSSGDGGTGAISSPSADDYVYDFDYPVDNGSNSRYSYTVSGLNPNQTYTYRVGFGVVDVDGFDRTSALLIDNVEVIPFEFSPKWGILILSTIILGDRIYKRKTS